MPPRSCVPDILRGCDSDVVDACPRAWSGEDGLVRMLGSVDSFSRAQVGESLSSISHNCSVYAVSPYDDDPAHFNQHVWIEAPVYAGNATLYALTHTDYIDPKTPKPLLPACKFMWVIKNLVRGIRGNCNN
jgi:hypothetical protein